jgi:hypothetical protein
MHFIKVFTPRGMSAAAAGATLLLPHLAFSQNATLRVTDPAIFNTTASSANFSFSAPASSGNASTNFARALTPLSDGRQNGQQAGLNTLPAPRNLEGRSDDMAKHFNDLYMSNPGKR